MTALVIAEHDNASLKASTLNTVTAASQCDADVHVLVAGHNCDAAAAVAAQIAGVSKVIVADNATFANGLAENVAASIVDREAVHPRTRASHGLWQEHPAARSGLP